MDTQQLVTLLTQAKSMLVDAMERGDARGMYANAGAVVAFITDALEIITPLNAADQQVVKDEVDAETRLHGSK